jgi:CheY-like chemotaxis protein
MGKTCPLEILLVDDNHVNITVGKRILELFGYGKVDSAMDGQLAIDAAQKKRYDLILLDLQMPVLDGFTAQKRIRASPLTGDPCIVALTANADIVSVLTCDAGYKESMADFTRKPSSNVSKQSFSTISRNR